MRLRNRERERDRKKQEREKEEGGPKRGREVIRRRLARVPEKISEFYAGACDSGAECSGRLIPVCNRVSYGLSRAASRMYNSHNPAKFPREKFSY